MTSSFGNIIGTPRDRLPDTGDNYARVEADLTDTVNKEIARQQADTKEFYNQMIEIELLKQKNFNDNLAGIADLVGNVAKFKNAFDANKEAREDKKRAKDTYSTTKGELLESKILEDGVSDSQQNAFLEANAKDDPQLLEFLKSKVLDTPEEVGLFELKDKLEITIESGIDAYTNNSNIGDKPTLAQANEVVEKAEDAAYTVAFLEAKRLGVDTNSREFKLYFIRELYPKIQKQKRSILNNWTSVNTRTFESKRTERADNYIKEYFDAAIDDKSIVKNISLNDPEKGIITRLRFDFTNRFKNDKEAAFYLVDRIGALAEAGKITRSQIEYFKNDAVFTNPSTGKFVKGFVNANIGNKADQNRTGTILRNALDKVTEDNSARITTLNRTYETKARDLRLESPDGELTDGQRAQLEADYYADAKTYGLSVAGLRPPSSILGDETVASSGERYSSKVGRADPLLGKVNITKDWVQSKRTAGLNTTSLSSIETIEATKAMGDLTEKVEKLMASDANITLDSAIASVYPQVLADLAAGNYKDDYDFLVPTTRADIVTDRNTIKTDANTALTQTGFISLHEKRALEGAVKYIQGGLKGEFPRYFEEVTRGLNLTPRQYALARLNATGGIDKNNRLIKDPLDKYTLTKEDRDYLLSFPNSTKNLNILNGDDDVSKEAEMLKIFHDAAGKPKDDEYLAPPNFLNNRRRAAGDQATVGQLYDLAKKGADKFGRYSFSTQEFIEIVDGAGVDKNAVFNEDTQSFMVLGLLRLQANKSNSITGAVTEGRNDWRRLTNLNIQEKEAVLQFFPNLRGMPNNQFQNLQADVAKAILDSVTTRDKNKNLVTP